MLCSFITPRHDTPNEKPKYLSHPRADRNTYNVTEQKQTSGANEKHTHGERARSGANDIIFIFVNEFRTKREEKLLTSAGLYYFLMSTIKFAVYESRKSTKGGSRIEWEIKQTKKKEAISFDFFSFSLRGRSAGKLCKRQRNTKFIALLLNHQRLAHKTRFS